VNALVDENPCYGELAATAERRQALWRYFLLGEDEREEELRQADWVVGDKTFRGGMTQKRGRPRRRVGWRLSYWTHRLSPLILAP
jgi:hypothetical protein